MAQNQSSRISHDPVTELGAKTQNLELPELKILIEKLQELFAEKVERRKALIEKELSDLSRLTLTRSAVNSSSVRHLDARSRVLPKYRSKRNPALTWSGRGSAPKWLLLEMKESKLKRESFRIL
jgi:DNA-binding protein H-NS